MHEGKERKKERRRTKLKLSRSIFSTVIRISGNVGVYFTIRVAKGLIYSRFASLCCVYLGAAPIP